jgi:hypothetical protein
MKKVINKTTVEGILVEKDLRAGVAQNSGTAYVAGKLQVETTEGNVITVEVYESEKTSKGLANQKYPVLKGIFDNGQAKHDGAANPTKLRIASALGTNDWFNKEGELVSSLINRGGFVNVSSSINPKADFEVDAVIKSVQPELRNGEETGRVYVNAIIFNYANQALPAKFVVENKAGVKYFTGIEPMTFIKIWGDQVNSTITNEKTEESAFGDAKVVKSSFTRKEFVITGANTEAYDESQLTANELQAALQARNLYIAELKTKTDAYQASKNAGGTQSTQSKGLGSVAVGDFKF